jgi:hypothetical protein
MDRAHKKAIRDLSFASAWTLDAVANVHAAGVAVPAHVATTDAIVAALVAQQAAILALVVVLQGE